ncbi:MAG: hypothetical protein RR620_06915 [Clostridium sp.]
MLRNEILEVLEENALQELEVLKDEEDCLLVRFFFDFDDETIAAAKAYSNDESDYEAESTEWYNEYYLPYLYDYASDEMVDMVEDIIEEHDIAGEVMGIQMDAKNAGFTQFLVLFTSNESTISMEDVAKDFIL